VLKQHLINQELEQLEKDGAKSEWLLCSEEAGSIRIMSGIGCSINYFDVPDFTTNGIPLPLEKV